MSLNLSLFLEESARVHPHKEAILYQGKKLTYSQLDALANRFANALHELGIGRGDKVALLLPNVPLFPIAYYGALKLGATLVPLNILFKEAEIAYHLEDSDAVVFVVWGELLEEARKGFHRAGTCHHLIVAEGEPPPEAIPLEEMMEGASPSFEAVQTMPDDTAVILYTAGTTGRPKGAELTHFNLFANVLVSADRLIGVKPEDVILAALPFFHSFGQTCVMHVSLYAGAAMSLLPHFEAQKALELIQRDRVTIFAGVPTMYFHLARFDQVERYDVSSLRLCVCGGAALSPQIREEFERRFGIPILEGYGLSETSPVASFNPPGRPRKPGSIGLPIWGVEMRIMDEQDQELPPGQVGEIVIRGHNVMKGYYKRPEATKEALRGGWFHTGDLGYVDEEGYFYIVDRLKDMILRGGFNVYPREVEDVLMAHPAVAECAVVGVPDEALGEEIKAYVVLREGAQATAEELIEYCKERMAAYKYPRLIEFRRSLPKTAAGRVNKSKLTGSGGKAPHAAPTHP